MARILIVGAGDVGGTLARQLAQQHQVWGLRRSSAENSTNLQWIQADVTRPETLQDLPSGLDLVIYSVASPLFTQEGYHDYYVNGVQHVLEALAPQSVRRFIFVSSSSVYHQSRGEWVDETSATEPRSFAGKELLQAEQLLLNSTIATTAVRFTGIYGPGRNRLIEQARHGGHCDPEPPVWTNRIHRDDCVGVLTLLCEKALAGEPLESVYLATDDEPATLFDVLEWMKDRIADVEPDHDVPEVSRRANRRCRNDRIKALGYEFRFRNYRAGYDVLLDELGYL
ncbi:MULTISPECIES: NAD(P)H-binding protein [unclassified Oceanobacter]|uniref:NAD(P)H-binding protein n=1 Tax=unclassified Oceanobacter TaxID=2620260 RepID=UPI0027344BE4|nr:MULTISPECIES: NAD(P)H-binding protein [unclassified Oceanobacter]MDP2506873.1 NAD(P)H-binding protein [Oceanobacter sp. 3_MG-2023]MDP2547798.1 NAD(P)H-binding protein [Oceanobacter sp. 4_MG-2023]